MIIQQLEYRRRRNASEVAIVDENGEIITLDADVAVRFQLARGMEISAEKLETIRLENEFLLARRKLISYLAIRKKSTCDAEQYLRRAGFSPAAISAAVDQANNLGYLNDTEFAEAFVRTRTKSGTKGPRMISKELQAKGLDPEEISRVIAPIRDNTTQLEAARRVAAKKYPSLKSDEDLFKSSRRMSQHLARRGFDPEICEQVTREYFGEPTQF